MRGCTQNALSPRSLDIEGERSGYPFPPQQYKAIRGMGKTAIMSVVCDRLEERTYYQSTGWSATEFQ